MTVLFPHIHIQRLSNDTNSQVCPSIRGKVKARKRLESIPNFYNPLIGIDFH
jgi:hypothetical protein